MLEDWYGGAGSSPAASAPLGAALERPDGRGVVLAVVSQQVVLNLASEEGGSAHLSHHSGVGPPEVPDAVDTHVEHAGGGGVVGRVAFDLCQLADALTDDALHRRIGAVDHLVAVATHGGQTVVTRH